MFMLNAQTILKYKQDGYLDIEPFDQTGLNPTWYYFRLAEQYTRWIPERNEWEEQRLTQADKILRLGPCEYVLIQSLEQFRCSNRVLATFGQSSYLPRKGLQLNHSPSIDPNFPNQAIGARLEMGLENKLDREITLELGERIGKVYFYSIADTYPVQDITNVEVRDTFERRATGSHPLPAYDDHALPGIEEGGGPLPPG